ncbi:MAG TPA: tripartite tricarboxylate transporter substrate binding protein [Reyranella sp.]|nr:tripartite tricarboxylate transporter substrate binding protein [Reyranella sp.]
MKREQPTKSRLATRRTVLGGGIAALGLPAAAIAQDFPSRAITIVVPFGPGTGNDIIARQVGQHLTGALGQSVIIDNRPGATGNIASDYVAKAQPNGYTIYLPSTSILLNQLVGTPNTNLIRDFEPIALSGALPYALAVPSSLPAQNVQELVALARSKPGQLNYAGYVGGVPQFLGEMLNRAGKVNIMMVPYKSTTDAATDFVAGNIQVLFTPVPSSLPFLQSKQGRVIAVTGTKRATILPDVPTMTEAGYPDLTVEVAYFFVTPAGTPKPVVDKLSGAITAALRDAKVSEALAKQGVEQKQGGPEETRAYLAEQLHKWEAIVKQSPPVTR